MQAIVPIHTLLAAALVVGCCAAFTGGVRAEDEVELLNGVKVRGQVVAESSKYVTINIQGSPMDLPMEKVYVLTVKDQRRVIHEKTAAAPKPAAKPEPAKPVSQPALPVKPAEPAKPAPAAVPASAPAPANPKDAAGTGNTRSRAEVEALIQKEGAASPAWWDSVQLNYPPTLDLTMSKAPKGTPWTPGKYISH